MEMNGQQNKSTTDFKQFQVKLADMNQLVMNYLVTEGHKEAAEVFRVEAGLETPDEFRTLGDRVLIRGAVLSGRMEEALFFFRQLYPEVLDTNPFLLFHLQQMQMVEMIRSGDLEGALYFGQNKLAKAGENVSGAIKILERTMALLAFENPATSPYADVLHVSHRAKLADEVNLAILNSEHNATSGSMILFLLKMILWAQNELDSRRVKYGKIIDLVNATIEGN